MTGTRLRRAARAMPVLLVVLLAFGLLSAGETGQEPPVRQPIGTGAVVLVAAPAVADLVAGARSPEHVLGRPHRTGSIAIPVIAGLLSAARLGGGRTSWWLPSLWAAFALAVSGVRVWRGRGPPRGVVDAFRRVTAGR